jgi:hypothetical protein
MRKKVRQGRGKEGWWRRMGKKARRKEREELEGEICEEDDKKLSRTFFHLCTFIVQKTTAFSSDLTSS